MTEPDFRYGVAEDQPAGSSVLDRLRSRTLATIAQETVSLPVRARDGFVVEFGKYMPREVFEAFVEGHQGDDDGLAKAVLNQQCRRVVMDGEPWLAGDGSPVTFKSVEFRDAFGKDNAFDAIREFYLLDPDVVRVSREVLAEAGWVQSADPTRP